MQVRENVGKSRNTVFFPMICGSGGSKSRLAKAAGAEPCGHMRDEKLHTVVVRSTFGSQNVQSTATSDQLWREERFQVKMQKAPRSEHFGKLRCSKSARRCGAKHIFEVKMYKAHHVRTAFGS